jgi:hypothetical protein
VGFGRVFFRSFVLTSFSRDKLRTKDRTKFVAHPSPPRHHLDDGLPIIARQPNFIIAFDTSQSSSPCFPTVAFKVSGEYEHRFGSCEFVANQKNEVSPFVLIDTIRYRDRESLLLTLPSNRNIMKAWQHSCCQMFATERPSKSFFRRHRVMVQVS